MSKRGNKDLEFKLSHVHHEVFHVTGFMSLSVGAGREFENMGDRRSLSPGFPFTEGLKCRFLTTISRVILTGLKSTVHPQSF